MEFCEKLKMAMKDLQLRQIDVANLTGKPKSSISQYVAGKVVPPVAEQSNIAVSLGLHEWYFEQEIPVVKFLKSDSYVIPQISTRNVAKLMRINVTTVQKGLQQKVYPWGYAVKCTKRWRYFINATLFAKMEGIDIPQNMIF